MEERPTSGSGSDKESKLEHEDDYDPHKHRHRVVPHRTTNLETLVHLLRSSLGTGILGMPQAFAKAGLVVGSLGTVVVGVIVTHCLHVLVREQYALCKRARTPLLSYSESMRATLKAGPRLLRPLADFSAPLVDFFLVIYQLGNCCGYIVFIAENLKRIVDPWKEMSTKIWMLIVLGPLMLISLIRDLKRLAPWSTAANVMTFAGLALVVYYLLAMPRSAEPLDLWGSGEKASAPLFFGAKLFAVTAVGVVVALENNMKTPAAFGKPCGVLNVGMSIIVLMYVLVGALGYVHCTSECKDSITLNLPPGDVLARVVMGLMSAAIFISYVLHCYVPVDVLWRGYVRPRLIARATTRLLAAEYALRLGLCLLTFVVAMAVPHLGQFTSLFSAFCLSALGVVFPALMELCAAWPAPRLLVLKDAALMAVGVVGCVLGTYCALHAIVRTVL